MRALRPHCLPTALRAVGRGALVCVLVLAPGALGAAPASTAGASVTLTGAGSTFAYPIYGKWAATYEQQTGVGLNYQSIGSGAGVQQIKARTVTFGASDQPLDIRQLDAAGLWQWPQVVGGVVPVVHLPGVKAGQLVLSGPVLADLYLGRIRYWDAPQIRALNPGLPLPHLWVAPVYRADGSGTTFLFTSYLARVSPGWKRAVGASTFVEWPVGIGAKGNEAVANMVDRTRGAIGYVEYAYVVQAHLDDVRMMNAAGRQVAPSIPAFEAAAASAVWKPADGFGLLLVNQPGADSWPITGATFVLVHRRPENAQAVAQVLRFFDWGFRCGKQAATRLGYVPLPASVVAQVEASWASRLRTAQGHALWPPGSSAPPVACRFATAAEQGS